MQQHEVRLKMKAAAAASVVIFKNIAGTLAQEFTLAIKKLTSSRIFNADSAPWLQFSQDSEAVHFQCVVNKSPVHRLNKHA
jgi:hypothetical protein